MFTADNLLPIVFIMLIISYKFWYDIIITYFLLLHTYMHRGLLYNGQNTMQAWGLIVLLVSKAAGHMNVNRSADEDKSGVLRSQRALAEIAEMIRTSHLMHNGLINIYPEMFSEPIDQIDMSYGNKIGLLSGDYLLANSFNELSMLKNQNVSNSMNKCFIYSF